MSLDRWIVLRGTASGPIYVRKLLPEPGNVLWTEDRDAAHRFVHRSEAAYVQRCIVARDGGAAAVVPDERRTNERAMAELNARAEW